MARVNIYSTSHPADEEEPVLLGWFDPDRAEIFKQGTRWDGNNNVGVITGSQWVDEYLYRTSGGKWVLNRDASRYHNGLDAYSFISDEQARDWLIRSQVNDEAVARYFGEMAEEEDRRPGRPAVGPAVNLRFPAEVLAKLDQRAADRGVSRADLVRSIVSEWLAAAQ